MLERFRKRTPKKGGTRRGRGASTGQGPPDLITEAAQRASKPSASSLATFDRLGQTLVATLLVSELSGSDAVELAGDLLVNLRGDGNVCRHVVLDLQGVQYMDSGCVGILVELLTRLQSNSGRIALVNTDSNVEYLFKLTRLDRLFPMCRDVMAAIQAVERAG
jgi:anti-sigma B factor antagonist